jgi:hypothetical protein
LDTKSLHSISSKNSQVTHTLIVSNNHHLASANTGLPAANTSTGTIPKSSSPGKINHSLFWTNETSSFPYFAQTKDIFFPVVFPINSSLCSHAPIITRLYFAI